MSINFVVNCHFTKIALLGLTHFLGTVSMNMFLRLWMFFLFLPFVQHGQDACHQFVRGLSLLILDAYLYSNILVNHPHHPEYRMRLKFED